MVPFMGYTDIRYTSSKNLVILVLLRFFFNPMVNGLVSGKIYRKPWFLPSNIGLSG
jgi:hypothetical protein